MLLKYYPADYIHEGVLHEYEVDDDDCECPPLVEPVERVDEEVDLVRVQREQGQQGVQGLVQPAELAQRHSPEVQAQVTQRGVDQAEDDKQGQEVGEGAL